MIYTSLNSSPTCKLLPPQISIYINGIIMLGTTFILLTQIAGQHNYGSPAQQAGYVYPMAHTHTRTLPPPPPRAAELLVNLSAGAKWKFSAHVFAFQMLKRLCGTAILHTAPTGHQRQYAEVAHVRVCALQQVRVQAPRGHPPGGAQNSADRRIDGNIISLAVPSVTLLSCRI